VELYSKTCDTLTSTDDIIWLDSVEGCGNLGRMYALGHGVAKDEFRAADNYSKACDWGMARSCRDLAISYQYGEGVVRDISKSVTLYKRACSMGDKNACDNAEKLQ